MTMLRETRFLVVFCCVKGEPLLSSERPCCGFGEFLLLEVDSLNLTVLVIPAVFWDGT